jgi:predicted RNA binding protein YcfA (HicA-like mRNA interferase family)
MAKLPSIGHRKVVKAFESLGWQVARYGKGHIIMTREGEIVTLAIPVHNPVAKGTLRSLIRLAGLTVEQFVSTL